jgi:hypothetical protein
MLIDRTFDNLLILIYFIKIAIQFFVKSMDPVPCLYRCKLHDFIMMQYSHKISSSTYFQSTLW